MDHSRGRWALFAWAIMVAGVFIGELLPGNSPIMQTLAASHISDKLLHFGAYFLLTLVPLATFRRSNALLTLFGLALMGGLLELLQQLVPGRSCDLADEAANMAGLVAGTVLVYGWRRVARAVA